MAVFLLALVVLVAACGRPHEAAFLVSGEFENWDVEAGGVLLLLPAEWLDELQGASPEELSTVFELRLPHGGEVDDAGAESFADEVGSEAGSGIRSELPAVHGHYRVSDIGIAFSPSFPLQPDTEYEVRISRPYLAGLLGTSVDDLGLSDLSRTWRTAPVADRPTVRVTDLFPRGDSLPENLLRMYLHFSGPMRQGVAYDYIRLLDRDGHAVELGLLELDHELWDPSGRRLTLLFDPGRLKSGLKPHREVGVPLAGRVEVTLEVDSAWPDAGGAAMGEGFRRTYSVGPPDRSQPKIEVWTIETPSAGSHDPLLVAFDGTLDHGMLQHSLWVLFEGREVPATVQTTRDEQAVELHPEAPWSSGLYELRVDPLLEDPSGNSVSRPFEVELLDGGSTDTEPPEPADTGTFRLAFRIAPKDG